MHAHSEVTKIAGLVSTARLDELYGSGPGVSVQQSFGKRRGRRSYKGRYDLVSRDSCGPHNMQARISKVQEIVGR